MRIKCLKLYVCKTFVYFAYYYLHRQLIMTFSDKCNRIFRNVCLDYHKHDDVNACLQNPYTRLTIEYSLYKKCWIDTVKCHLEEIICNSEIEPITALYISKRIDKLNQDSVDLIELIDAYFREKYKHVKVATDTTINYQSPASIINRLSILALKIYHTQQKVECINATAGHIQKSKAKLDVLLEQRITLSSEIDTLLNDLEEGHKYMKDV